MSPPIVSAEPLFSADDIQRRVSELAVDIEADTPPTSTIHLVGTLTGSFMFLADLARALSRPVTIDFVRCSSYGSATASSGTVEWSLEPRDMADKDVLLVEDIIDSGTTLHTLRERLSEHHPRSLRSVCLLNKPARRTRDVPVEFIGFTIDDVFVVGYGLDHAEQHRHLPYIAVLTQG